MRTLITVGLALLASPSLAQSQCDGTDTAPATIAEIVSFQLADGADAASFTEAAKTSLAFLCDQDGFVRRTLTVADDGTWTDIVQWETLDAAQGAMAQSQQTEALLPFMSAMNMESLAFSYATIVDLGTANEGAKK